MTFALPLALLLVLPLAVAAFLVRPAAMGLTARLPGAWERVVADPLKPFVSARARTGNHGAPLLCLTIGMLVIGALSRPGIDAENPDAFATLVGRVIVIEVGADLARHRHVIDDLYDVDPEIPTAVVLSSGDAYRIVPFTTDKAQIDRYVRVVEASMIPNPGRRPHIGLARAEQVLARAGILVGQIVLISALPAPEDLVPIPASSTDRIVIPIDDAPGWEKWAAGQSADPMDRSATPEISARLVTAAREVAISELPAARVEFTSVLIGLAACLWLIFFRRRSV